LKIESDGLQVMFAGSLCQGGVVFKTGNVGLLTAAIENLALSDRSVFLKIFSLFYDSL